MIKNAKKAPARGRPPLCTLSKQKHTKHCRALNDEAVRECRESRRGVKVGLLSHKKFAWRAERLFKLLCNLADPKQIILGACNLGIWLRHGTYLSFWPRGAVFRKSQAWFLSGQREDGTRTKSTKSGALERNRPQRHVLSKACVFWHWAWEERAPGCYTRSHTAEVPLWHHKLDTPNTPAVRSRSSRETMLTTANRVTGAQKG